MRQLAFYFILLSYFIISLTTCITISGTKKIITIGIFSESSIEESFEKVIQTIDFKSKFPDFNIAFQIADLSGHHERIVKSIEGGDKLNDIETLEIGYLARFARSGGFTDLAKPPYNGLKYTKGLSQYAVSNAITWEGNQIAYPISIATALLFYRKSFFDHAGLNIDELHTWEDIIDAGKKLTIDLDSDGKIDRYAFENIYDISLIPLNGGKGNWFNENNIPLEPIEPYIKTLEIIKTVHDLGLAASTSPPWLGRWNRFPELNINKVAMLFSGNWMYNYLKTWLSPSLSGDWCVAYPDGIGYASYGGTYIGIPENTPIEKKAICFEIIKFLCTNYNAQLIMFESTMAYPSYTPVHSDPIMSIPSEYLGGQKIFELCREVAAKIPPAYISRNDALAVDIFIEAIRSVIEDDVPIKDAYANAKEEIKNSIYKE